MRRGKKIGAFALSILLLLSVFFTLAQAQEEEGAGEAMAISETNGKAATGSVGEMPAAVKAKAAILMDAATGRVLLSMNEHERLYPASVTKIMTLLLVVEAIDAGQLALTDQITASKDAVAKGGSQIWLKEGETMTVDQLLKAAAIGSANDACVALAEQIAGSEEGFVERMNARAKELGMMQTHFENCSGLDDTVTDHMTSAFDIALMSKELISHDLIKNYTTIWMDSLRDGATELVNTNKLIRFYKGATGLKTGTTNKAGSCLSATAEREGTSLIAVVLGSENSNDRFESAKAMLNWGFSNWAVFKPELDMSMITDVTVLHGTKASVSPLVPKLNSILVKKGTESQILQNVSLCVDVEAPVEEGQVLGKVVLTLGEEVLGEYELLAPESVEKMGFKEAIKKLIASLAEFKFGAEVN